MLRVLLVHHHNFHPARLPHGPKLCCEQDAGLADEAVLVEEE